MIIDQKIASELAAKWELRERGLQEMKSLLQKDSPAFPELKALISELARCRRELCAAFGLDSGSLPLATQPPSEAASSLRKPSEEPTKEAK